MRTLHVISKYYYIRELTLRECMYRILPRLHLSYVDNNTYSFVTLTQYQNIICVCISSSHVMDYIAVVYILRGVRLTDAMHAPFLVIRGIIVV